MAFTASRLLCTLTVTASLFAAPAVWAHAHLKHQYPAADAVMESAPQALTLNFSEGIEPAFSGITLVGPEKQKLETGKAKVAADDNKQLIVPLSAPLPAGQYQVDWHVVSVDGHKTKGSYYFSVK
ncbi:CopC domain-containing protein YobA [Atlantibacter subterranea]|uniref:Copper resistance protein C n=1 Tax=Atlantibacter subterraneus TaxID=255519 RepID=A0A427UY46_9ENTR|nr:CopC domain-containing protein YobA [Atlantibacter subterranea]MDA3133190.1 CopC domain-containing protein YobA [Atlantibacter subterranea]RSB65499.1 CopC domain-containing protein YobA [Atlantibacter subterranea]RSE08446.1 CopC domain-containing protein YobA [Atlantibacter subterranea]RSE25298.1 CopC domain-containing protein YobA [Atlantibacter subterranea]